VNPAAILCDIEGTTSSLSFVHNVLFPMSYDRMEDFIRTNWDSNLIAEEIKTFQGQDSEDVIRTLRFWILEDRKDPILKSIQGKIWKDAFESGAIKGHVYPDVPENFRKWNNQGIKVCIFSSGSVEAQKLLFQYSEAGNLTQYLSEYFDTGVGTKKSSSSYTNIASQLSISPANILFLSDVEDELNAARKAQLQTIQVLREDVVPNISDHRTVKTFSEISEPL
jgi:enolase-phosphatase E1